MQRLDRFGNWLLVMEHVGDGVWRSTDGHNHGRAAACRSCAAKILWAFMPLKEAESYKPLMDYKAHPFNPDGTSHFSTCPNAEKHRKVKHGKPASRSD